MSKKKNSWIKLRHKIVVGILRHVFKLMFRIKNRLKTKTTKLPDEGSIILSNHVTALDPFVVGTKFNKNLYYMASKDLFQKRFVGKVIKFLVNPIPKEKSNKGDLAAIKMCVQVAKENGNICIFPEGNRTFSGKLGNIDYSIVKLVKMLKKPLYLVNIVGGYPSDPRWSNKRRKGKMDVVINKKLEYEEYKDLSNDELYNLIVSSLSVDDHSLNVLFKGKKKAEYLESILFTCPICGKEHSIYTEGNYIMCKNCDLQIEYKEDLTLHPVKDTQVINFKYVYEWYDYQIELLKSREYEDEEVIFEDDIEVYEPRMFKSKTFIGKGKVSLYNNSFKFKFENEELELDFNDIFIVTLLGRKKMNIYYKDKIYQLYNNRRTNLIKYMFVYYIIKNRKEGIENGFIGI